MHGLSKLQVLFHWVTRVCVSDQLGDNILIDVTHLCNEQKTTTHKGSIAYRCDLEGTWGLDQILPIYYTVEELSLHLIKTICLRVYLRIQKKMELKNVSYNFPY